jgi:hypothetical protein
LTQANEHFSIVSFAPAVVERFSCSDTVSIAVALNCGSPPMPYRVQTAPGQSVGSGRSLLDLVGRASDDRAVVTAWSRNCPSATMTGMTRLRPLDGRGPSRRQVTRL